MEPHMKKSGERAGQPIGPSCQILRISSDLTFRQMFFQTIPHIQIFNKNGEMSL